AAVAYGCRSVTFRPSSELPSNSLREKHGGELVTVNTITLGKILDEREIGAFTLICDIEGHEYELVQHEAEVLKRASVIILETHARMIGESKTSELLLKLEEIGFLKIDEEATVVVLARSA
ncbi:MAG TPA: FkbM family methyltransferase, partial [Acidobacteriaceae bacterium]|nr:FkbM family methyltransferase [Acidobacteriaceae bacterium]